MSILFLGMMLLKCSTDFFFSIFVLSLLFVSPDMRPCQYLFRTFLSLRLVRGLWIQLNKNHFDIYDIVIWVILQFKPFENPFKPEQFLVGVFFLSIIYLHFYDSIYNTLLLWRRIGYLYKNERNNEMLNYNSDFVCYCFQCVSLLMWAYSHWGY